jgi:hypothetical protein
MSLKSAGLLAPKMAVFVAGVFFAAARWLWAGDAGESPYGSGETGDAGAGTDVLEECLVWGPLKGAFWCSSVFFAVRVGRESTGSSSAGSQTAAPGQRRQCRRPMMRSVAACGVLRERVVYAGRVDCLWCVELLPTPVGAAAVMNSRRGRGC